MTVSLESAVPGGPRTLRPGPAVAGSRPATLGVMGGGQLARMFAQAAQAMGFRVAVLDPDADSPAAQLADLHVQAGYDDLAGLERLAQQCDAVTTEFENVPAASLEFLARTLPVAPAAAAVATCQHRAHEKACFVRSGVPCAPHAWLQQEADLAGVDAALLPGILKTATLGYDGKGQVPVGHAAELPAAWHRLGGVPALLEQRVPLRVEFSVVIARDAAGRCVHLPVQQNLHRDGILAVTQVPAPQVPEAAAQQALACSRRLAESLGYVGVLCVEFFLLEDGRVLANEMAPRPHNSGHASLDACDVSQFELQVRTLAGLPLPEPRLHSPAVMLNLLGDLWGSQAASAPLTTCPPWDEVLALPGAHLHLYGKAQARPGRKMGHLTLTAATADQALERARTAASLLGLPRP